MSTPINDKTPHASELHVLEGESRIIRDLSFSGPGNGHGIEFTSTAENPAVDVIIQNCDFTDHTCHIYSQHCHTLRIENCTFGTSNRDAIRVGPGHKNVIITNCVFNDVGDPNTSQTGDAVDLYPSTWEEIGTERIIISNNIVNGGGCIGFDLKGVHGSILVSGNLITGTKYSGIVIATGNAVVVNNYIENCNTAQHHAEAGIVEKPAYGINNICRDNEFYNSPGYLLFYNN